MPKDIILASFARNNQTSHFTKSFKRDLEEINEEELKERGKKCKDIEISSGVAGFFGDLVSDIGDVVGAIPVIGDIAKAVTVNVKTWTHVIKNGLDISSTALDCSQVPFDEIKLLINKKFNEVERKLDKQTEILGEISRTVSTTLVLVERTRAQMREGFKNVVRTINDLDLKNKIDVINSFIEYYDEEMDIIRGKPKQDYIEHLKTGVLEELIDIRRPEGLRNSLFLLMTSNHLNSHTIMGETKLQALYALVHGTKTYVSVMFFLLEQFSYLENYYYKLRDLERFNTQINSIKKVYDEFSFYLVRGKNSLIDKVIETLEKANLSPSNDIRGLSSDIFRSLSVKASFLRQLKTNIRSINLSLLDDEPVNDIEITLNLPSPKLVGAWQKGAKVRYAVQYENNKIYSKVSKWSREFGVSDMGNPYIRISNDDMRNRLIFRKINNSTPQLIGVIRKSETDLRDISRDLYNVASNPNEAIALSEVQEYMDNGADLNARFEDGRTVIHSAALAGHVEVVQYLLKRGDNINREDVQGYTPLHIAAKAGRGRLVEFLVKSNSNVTATANTSLITPLHLASKNGFLDCVKFLLQSNSINVNQKDKYGFTPLHAAINGGNLVVQAFVERNDVDYNAESKIKLTPLHLAVINDNLDVIKTLEKTNDLFLSPRDSNDLTPLHYTAIVETSQKTLDITRYLVSSGRIDIEAVAKWNRWTPLHLALFLRKSDVALLMMDVLYINVDFPDADNVTVLHLAAATGQEEVARKILRKKPKIDLTSKSGYTALHLAAMGGHVEVVSMLIESKAEIDFPSQNGTALYLAAAVGRAETVRYLINSNADVYLKRKNLNLPIHEAVANGNLEVMQIFLEKDSNLGKMKDSSRQTIFDIASHHCYDNIIRDLIKRGFDLNAQNPNGETALHNFANAGNLEMVKFLISKGAKVNLEDKKGNSFFDFAAQAGRTEIVKFVYENKVINMDKLVKGVCTAIDFNQLEIIKYFVGSQKEYFCDPLQTAALKGQLNIVKYLVEEESMELNSIQNQQTALCNAAKGGHFKIVQYLIENGADVHQNCSTENKMYNPLIQALKNNNFDIAIYLMKLFENVDNKDKFGNTPLFYAAMFGCTDCASYLIENKKVDLNAKNAIDLTALKAACAENDAMMISYLQSKGADGTCELSTTELLFLRLLSVEMSNLTHYNDPFKIKSKYGFRFRRADIDAYANGFRPGVTEMKNKFFKLPSSSQAALKNGSSFNAIQRPIASQLDTNGALLLLDVLIRKLTKEKYKSISDREMSNLEAKAFALRMTEEFENFLSSINNSPASEIIDFSEVYSKIFRAIINRQKYSISSILLPLLRNITESNISGI